MAKTATGFRRTFRINNMTGLMNTMAEENAYLTLDPNANLGAGAISVPFEFKNVTNWMPLNRGGLSKTFGYSLHKNTGSGTAITGLYRFTPSSGSSQFLVSTGSTLYTLSAGVLTATGMTVSNNAYLHFETAYDKAIVCDGFGDPKTYDGSTVANLSSGADATVIQGARQSAFYANRLFLFSATHDTSLLYYSDPGNIAAGYASNFIACDVNDGQKITAIAKFFIPGDLSPVIIVAKDRSIGVVTGDGTTDDPYTFSKISNDLGVPGFRQIVQYQQDATLLTQRGVTSYRTALQNNNIEQALLTRNITNQFTSLNSATLNQALAWFDWRNRRITYALPSPSSSVPDTLWHYDVDLRGWYRQNGFTVTAAFVDTDGYVYTGNNTGEIFKHDPAVNQYNGGTITATLQTPYLDFYEPEYHKRINHARIVVRGNGEYQLGVSTSLNYGTSQGSSHTIPISSGSYGWNGGVWTNNVAVYRWGASPLNRHKFFPGGIFQNIAFTFTQAGSNEPVDFLEMLIEVEYLNLI